MKPEHMKSLKGWLRATEAICVRVWMDID